MTPGEWVPSEVGWIPGSTGKSDADLAALEAEDPDVGAAAASLAEAVWRVTHPEDVANPFRSESIRDATCDHDDVSRGGCRKCNTFRLPATFANALRLAADELERAHRVEEEIAVPWWWLRDRADRIDRPDA